MNRRMVFYTVGRMLMLESLLFLLPAVVALIYLEIQGLSFLAAALVTALAGLLFILTTRPQNKLIYAKEGFIIVALSWILFSLFGALPFVFSGEIPNYANALFETASGFSTTGSSILNDVEALSHCTAFWRSFTHWVGGMGILVFIVALMPNVTDRSIHILRAEMPGHTMGKLVPRLKDTAKILYLIYIALTVTEIIFLLAGGMPLFDSFIHAFGTAGTGGFGIKSDSIASYSPYLQWVITVFMLIFGVNFNIYYLILIRRFRSVFRSVELWCYLATAVISTIAVTVSIYSQALFHTLGEAIRTGSFQVASILTTTGYSTADFDTWPTVARTVLLLLMFVGGCSGSTAGGLKFSRVIILFKMIRRELRRMLHPRSLSTVKFEGKTVDDVTLHSVSVYFAFYMVCTLSCFLLLSFEPFGFETNFSATVACFNNIGPGFAGVGPAATYADYSVFSKLLLSFMMLLGRLEIFPLFLAFSPSAWSKK